MEAKVRRERKESPCLAVSCSIFARTNHLHWQGPVPGKNSLKFCCHRPRVRFLTRSGIGRATAVGPDGAFARRIEGCKRQATDLLARDFYSLSLPTLVDRCNSPSSFTFDENGRSNSEDAWKLFCRAATIFRQIASNKDYSWINFFQRRTNIQTDISFFSNMMWIL